MDLQSFSEEDFDPKKWINRAWNSCGNQEKEIFVGNSVTRLQLYMKQLTNSLDETTTQIVTSVPRILQDASSLQLEGAMLQQRLISLELKVQGVEEQTGQSIQSLQKIDQLKSRLENAASALREADKWAAQVTSLEAILENGVSTDPVKLTELSELVGAMTVSLEVLSDAPDYDTKRLQLETLYNRLEAAITPPLLEALMQMDAERSSNYVRILSSCGRAVSSCRSGRRAAASRAAAQWAAATTHTVRGLNSMLAQQAKGQVEWFANVIKSDTPVSEMVRLYTDLLLSLEPPPTKVVSASLKLCSSTEEGLTLLIDLRRDIDEFVTCIQGVIELPAFSKEKVETTTLRQLGRAAYAPLRHSLNTCTSLLTRELVESLGSREEQEDLIEQSRALLALSEKCESSLSTTYNKVKMIAGICACVCYTPAVEAFITEFSSRITSQTRRIESQFLTSVSTNKCTGVLSNTFPAALILENAVNKLLEVLAERQKIYDIDSKATPNPHPLSDIQSVLLTTESISQLESLRIIPPLPQLKRPLSALARDVLMQPLHSQLDKIPTLSVWSNNSALSSDLPDFALSPQEYMTEIGQYLMTLPQHLELQTADRGLQLLYEVCNKTCDLTAERILNVRNMDQLGTRRCLTDIEYLSSVVEDLGSSVTPSLKNLITTSGHAGTK